MTSEAPSNGRSLSLRDRLLLIRKEEIPPLLWSFFYFFFLLLATTCCGLSATRWEFAPASATCRGCFRLCLG